MQKYNAKKAGDASIDLYLAHYIEAHQPFIQSAVVVDVRDKAFEVIVLKTGSLVRLSVNVNVIISVLCVCVYFKKTFLQDFEEGVKWKAVSIPISNEAGSESGGKKLWKIEVSFPPLQCTTQSITTIIERFAIVNVALTRKEKTNKLEARLVAPIPTISFSNNGDSSTFVFDDEVVSDSGSI